MDSYPLVQPIVLFDQFGNPLTAEVINGRNTLAVHDAEMRRALTTMITDGLPADRVTERPVRVVNDTVPIKTVDGDVVTVTNDNTFLPPTIVSAVNDTAVLDVQGNHAISMSVVITGAITLNVQLSADGVVWTNGVTVSAYAFGSPVSATNVVNSGSYFVGVTPFRFARVIVTATAAGASAVVFMYATTGVLAPVLGASAATIGAVMQSNGFGTGSASVPWLVSQHPSDLCVSILTAVNAAGTVTLPAAGAGKFHYITAINIKKLYNVLGVAAAAGVNITSANLPGNPSWVSEQSATAAGSVVTVLDQVFDSPLKSAVANTNTQIIVPAQAQTIWSTNVHYFVE